MRILVVEDDARVADVARRVLSAFGSTVDVAGTAAAAFALLQDPARAYHVVVIDRVLPDMSGDEIAVEVGSLHPDTGIVLTSGLRRTERPIYDAWLAKPYVSNDLIRAVVTAAAARSRRRYRSSLSVPAAGKPLP